jgi:hypothetical protein
VAVVDGNRTKNFNKTGVRLWTAPALDQDGEDGCGDPFDSIAHRPNRGSIQSGAPFHHFDCVRAPAAIVPWHARFRAAKRQPARRLRAFGVRVRRLNAPDRSRLEARPPPVPGNGMAQIPSSFVAACLLRRVAIEGFGDRIR